MPGAKNGIDEGCGDRRRAGNGVAPTLRGLGLGLHGSRFGAGALWSGSHDIQNTHDNKENDNWAIVAAAALVDITAALGHSTLLFAGACRVVRYQCSAPARLGLAGWASETWPANRQHR